MTYLTFLLLFIAFPIVILAILPPRPLSGHSGRKLWLPLALVCAVALVYTTPWDNYLVYRKIWFYGPDRVIGVIGYVPIEEYLFFLLQPVLTGLFLYHVMARNPLTGNTIKESLTPRVAGAAFFLTSTVIGAILLATGWNRGYYLGLILAWACPVLCIMWGIAGPLLWGLRRQVGFSIIVPTLYLWIADRIAIASGIWDISNTYSLNLDPLGLPVEEATFFLLTNILVVQGIILFLYGNMVRFVQGQPDSIHP